MPTVFPIHLARLVFWLASSTLLAAIISLVMVPRASMLAQRAGALAVPRDRDVHQQTVPRWGGLAIFLGFIVPVGLAVICLHRILAERTLIQGAGIVLGAIIITVVGAVDDRKELPPVPRLGAQALAGLAAYAGGVRIQVLHIPFAAHAFNTHLFSAPLTIFWLMLVMNAINWLDGLDGLAAGVCFIVSGFLTSLAIATHQPGLALLCAALAGSTLGFLRHNYAPAKIYMGGGAEFLGFVLGAISIVGAFKQAATVAILLPVMAMGVPLLDSVHVVLRRAASGSPVYQADRTHVHHALIDMGLTKEQAVLVIYLATTVLCFLAWAIFAHSAGHAVPRVTR